MLTPTPAEGGSLVWSTAKHLGKESLKWKNAATADGAGSFASTKPTEPLVFSASHSVVYPLGTLASFLTRRSRSLPWFELTMGVPRVVFYVSAIRTCASYRTTGVASKSNEPSGAWSGVRAVSFPWARTLTDLMIEEEQVADSGVIELVLKGLAAGAVGTAAMTLSEKVEQSKSGREDSMVTTEVGAILHVHAWMEGIPATDVNYPCGTQELAIAVADLVALEPDPAHAVIGLRNHGLTCTGDSLSEVLDRVAPKVLRQVPMT